MALTPEFLQRVAARAQTPVDQLDPEFVAELVAEAHAHLLMYAPCKKTEWADPEAMPGNVTAVLVGSVAASVVNPRGVVAESLGGYSWQATGASVVGQADGWFTPSDVLVIQQESQCHGRLKSVTLTPNPGVPLVKTTWADFPDYPPHDAVPEV